MIIIFYLLIFILGFLVPVSIGIFGLFGIISDVRGAPYVPTSAKIVDEILERAKLKRGQVFLELGSGDGRVVRRAVQLFGVKGVGVDVNIPLIYYSRLLVRLANLKNITFKVEDIFKTDLSKAQVIFNFLLPKTLKKLAPRFKTECKKGTLIISHGFKIEGMEKEFVFKIDRKLFPTYYYKV